MQFVLGGFFCMRIFVRKKYLANASVSMYDDYKKRNVFERECQCCLIVALH